MRKCYIISFDLYPNRDYKNLVDAIKTYGTWARITESTFAIVTLTGATEIRKHLVQYLKQGDRIFIIKAGGEAAWRNAISDSDWLKKYLSI